MKNSGTQTQYTAVEQNNQLILILNSEIKLPEDAPVRVTSAQLIAIWIVELAHFLFLLIKVSFNCSAYPFQESSSGCKLCFCAMDDKPHKEIIFLHQVFTIFVRIQGENVITFSWKRIYFFLVLRIVCEGLPVGFTWSSPLHFAFSPQISPLKIAGN